MDRWRIWGFLLLLLACNAVAGQHAQYYVDNRWGSGTSATNLPHYRSPQEACIVGNVQRELRNWQAGDHAHQWRYIQPSVGQDDGFSEFLCGGQIQYFSGSWITKENLNEEADIYANGPFGSSETCTLGSGYNDPETGQCGPPKKTCCEVSLADSIDAASGNKHQVEIDFSGAGTFPLHFGRTYDSSRTWLNNPLPLGIGWTHSYLTHIDILPTQLDNTLSQAVAHRPDGSIVRFNLIGSSWTPDADIALRLSVALDSNGIASATLTDADDTVEKYDQLGRLASITNRDGLTQTISYAITSAGVTTYYNDVQQVTDPQGHTLTFGYNSNGQLASVTDGNGATIQYNYGDANGNLTSVVYPDLSGGTKTRTYSYNETGQVTGASWPNALTGIVDENNQRFASWGYDSQGRATSSVHGPYVGGTIDKTTLTFNSNGTTTFTDALGQARTYAFNVLYQVAHPASLDTACDTCSAHDKARTYDSATGYSKTSTDFDGNQSTYVFTGNTTSGVPGGGLETQRVEGIPPASNPTDTTSERTINTTWNPNFRVPAQRTVLDSTNTIKEQTNWVYNTRGQPTFRCMVDPTVSGASAYPCGSQTTAPNGVRQWAWTYCESGGGCPLVGQLLTSKGPRTDVNDLTTYAYYPSDDSTCATAPTTCPHRKGDLQTVTQAVTSSLNLVTTYVSYDGDGRPTRILDANNVPTDFTYHPRGWLTQRAVRGTNNNLTTDDQITGYSYDVVGQVTEITHPANDLQTFTYDNAHRLTDITDSLGNKLHYALDNAGNRTEEDSIGHGGGILRKVLRDYDILGRLHDQKNAVDGSLAMTYFYDNNGNATQLTDGRSPSHVTSNSYDPLNRLSIAEQDAGGLNVFTNYTYDALDRLTDVQDSQNLHTTYTFDALGNQKQLASPDTGTTLYGYDAAGNRTSQQDARPDTATYSYDALNRLIGIAYPTTSLNVGYLHDAYNGSDETNCPVADRFPSGHLTYFSDSSGSTQFCYDRFGNMALKIQTILGATFDVAYKFNKNGQVTQITEPAGTIVTYTRDGDTRIVQANYQLKGQTTPTPVVRNIAYDPFGPVTGITYDNGNGNVRTLSRSYDTDYVIQSVKDSSAVGDGLKLTYGRDAVGNLTQVNSATTVGNILTYDGLNRLTNVDDYHTGSPVWTYTYDGVGNRTGKQQGTQASLPYTYYPNTHWLMAVGDISPVLRTYDNVGNTKTIGSAAQTFVYDDTNRLAQLKNGSTQVKKYAYDARGERVRKSHDGFPNEVVRTVYDEAGHTLGDFDSSNNIIDEYIWLDDLPIGMLSGATPTLEFIEPDHLGTPRTVIDPASNHAVWAWPLVNDPFGETQPQNLNGSTLTLNLRLPGQVFDAESGLSYNYLRDYDSATGRYVESDPAGLRGGMSTYAYAHGNPELWTDARGLNPITCSNIQQRAGAGATSTIECDGHGGYEVVNCNNNKCTKKCDTAHENQHILDWQTRYGKNSCAHRSKGDLPDDSSALSVEPFDSFHAKSECRAYAVGIKCAQGMLGSCACSKDASDYISNANYWRARWSCSVYGL